MFDWMLPENHAIAILKKDQDNVRALFDDFEKAEKTAAKEKIIGRAVTALKILAVIEEEIFYPTVRAHVGGKIMNEADEEHHLAKVLIAELDRGSGSDHRDAKFTVLAETVRHHIRQEENEMLPKAKELDIDFEALGRRMQDRKKQLEKDGIPPDAEHAMVARAMGRGDSPAKAASSQEPSRARKTSAKVSSSRVRSRGRPIGGGKSWQHRRVPKENAGSAKVMKDHKQGTLKSGGGKRVKSRKQAVAIALSEARKSGARIPKKKS